MPFFTLSPTWLKVGLENTSYFSRRERPQCCMIRCWDELRVILLMNNGFHTATVDYFVHLKQVVPPTGGSCDTKALDPLEWIYLQEAWVGNNALEKLFRLHFILRLLSQMDENSEMWCMYTLKTRSDKHHSISRTSAYTPVEVVSLCRKLSNEIW